MDSLCTGWTHLAQAPRGLCSLGEAMTAFWRCQNFSSGINKKQLWECLGPYFEHWIRPLNQKLQRILFSKLADVYTDLSIEFASKKYCKLTPHILDSIHLIKSYKGFFFQVSLCVQWCQHWICLKKLPQNDSSYAWIHPLNQKLQRILFSKSADVYSDITIIFA